MKLILTLISLTFYFNLFSQDKLFCQTYDYEGYILSQQLDTLHINMNYLILLDSTIVGSYYYKSPIRSLKLIGHLSSNNSFTLTERNNDNLITGFLNGMISKDKKSISGYWNSSSNKEKLILKLNQGNRKFYGEYIAKNRSFYEYSDLNIAIEEKEKVLSIDVANQGLTNLPEQLSSLPNIASINLLGNNFTHFPTVLSNLLSLDEISLSSNKLTVIGPEIEKLNNLRILIINNNYLKSLPKEIGNLPNLLYLEIGNNELKTLPKQISKLRNLQVLHIERNELNEREKKRIKKLLPNCVIHF